VLRVPVHQLEAGEITLDPDASRYVARVRRVCEGESILLFEPREAKEAEATLIEIGRAGVRCRVGTVRTSTARPHRPITLLQGIGKGEKLDAIVRDATELGATRVVAVETERSVVKLGDRSEGRRNRWRRVAVEAARQCGRGDIPEVTGPLAWPEALAIDSGKHALRLCLWENATDPIGPKLRSLSPERPLVIAVGPEGGFEEPEINLASSNGFAIVSLGPFILRTETVAAAVLGAVLALGQ
jgi:16S rRNA (uracil1498-N3)-methyltransferase